MNPMTNRREIDGEFQYKAVVVCDGQKVTDTVYSDWFATDDAAMAGFREIMEGQGYTVAAVRIGELTEVEISS